MAKAELRCDELFSTEKPTSAPVRFPSMGTAATKPPEFRSEVKFEVKPEAASMGEPSKKASEDSATPSRPTAIILGLKEEANFETFFRVKKLLEETSWSSNYSPRGYDPQGSAVYPIAALGLNLARVLGFSWKNRNEILVPTPATLNARIEAFNGYLMSQGIAPIPIRFYLQIVPKIEMFLRRWAQKAEIPIAAGLDNHTLHDLGFHLTSILLPPEIVELIRIEAALASKWLLLKENRISDGLLLSVRFVDSFSTSANLAEGERHTESLSGFLRQYVSHQEFGRMEWSEYLGLSPFALFNRRISHSENPPWNDAEMTFERMQTYFKEQEVLANLHEQFLNEIKTENPEWLEPLSSRPSLQDAVSIEDLFVKRASTLRRAADEFLRLQTKAESAAF